MQPLSLLRTLKTMTVSIFSKTARCSLKGTLILLSGLLMASTGCNTDSSGTVEAGSKKEGPRAKEKPLVKKPVGKPVKKPAVKPVAKPVAKTPSPKKGYAEVVTALDKRMGGLQRIVDKRPKGWLMRSHLLGLLTQRASLTHSFQDYARLQKILDDVLSVAPAGAGPPLLLAAQFNFTMHRLNKAEEHLGQFEKLELLRKQGALTISLLRADIAFHRGQYSAALTAYRAAARRAPAAVLSKLAIYYSKTGGFLEAEALLDRALTGKVYSNSHGRSWLMLQRAILSMEQGRYEQAMARLKEADKEFPGWWLIREHIAEVHTLLGQDVKAAAIYEQVVRNTRLPQFMDALGACYQRMGRKDEAQKLIAEAGKLWDDYLTRFPEAAGGHGLEHYLEYGKDPKRALELALINFKARPGGEARVLLATAYLKAGQAKKALEQVQSVLTSPFRSADLHDVARQTYTALGSKAEAAKQRTLCLAINPKFYADDDR
jgi:tetratricopeptide (TPR) repeat protein